MPSRVKNQDEQLWRNPKFMDFSNHTTAKNISKISIWINYIAFEHAIRETQSNAGLQFHNEFETCIIKWPVGGSMRIRYQWLELIREANWYRFGMIFHHRKSCVRAPRIIDLQRDPIVKWPQISHGIGMLDIFLCFLDNRMFQTWKQSNYALIRSLWQCTKNCAPLEPFVCKNWRKFAVQWNRRIKERKSARKIRQSSGFVSGWWL